MNAEYIYAVKKAGKFLVGQDYCTGHKSRATWTDDPRRAQAGWKTRIEQLAKETGGRVVVLEHLSPQVGALMFRLENDLLWDGEGGMKISTSTFLVERRTPRGVWVRRLWPNGATGKMEAPSWEKPRFILDGKGKRHAYVDKRDALASFRARKERQVQHLESRLLQAKAALEFLDRTDFEPDRVFYSDTLRAFREY